MKKLLILVLIALLVTFAIFITLNGVKLGSVEVLGIKGLQERNLELDQKIQEATKLASTDYKKIVNTLEENAQKLKKEKQNYEEMTAMTTEGEVQAANQIEKYEVETLWVRVGNHATSEGAIMKMDVTKGSNNAPDNYDLKFTVTGSYISITDFISDIENDSMLGFKIEDFKMEPVENFLQATFTCRDITIVDISAITPEKDVEKIEEDGENQEEDSAKENTTNTTNSSNTTSNTSNTTNTTNTTKDNTTKTNNTNT